MFTKLENYFQIQQKKYRVSQGFQIKATTKTKKQIRKEKKNKMKYKN